LFINNLTDVPRCPICNEYVKFIGTLKRGYNKYCSIKCLNKSDEHKNKIISTFQNKYNCRSHNQVDEIKNKKRITLINSYGVDNPMKNNNIKKRQINSLIKNYGVDNPMKIKSVIEKRNKNIEIGEELNIKRMLNRITDNTIIYIGHNLAENNNVNFHCLNCKNDFKINSNLLTSRISNNTTICTICNKNKSFSEIQKSLENFITSLNINYESKNRDILNGLEIDIYLPEHKLGIEIDGLYWHSNKFKDKNYHLNKTNLCEQQGIQLLHIFEDEWVNKKDIVKSIIKSKLSIIENKIFARKCHIKEIDSLICNNFLNDNHIQGNINSKVKIGLFYNNDLVSVMTFGKKRVAMGNKTNIEGEYEMHRFCNKLNTQVVGGASKLLSYFIKTYLPKSILTFADRRYGQGNLYKQLGFNYIKNTPPNYWYILPGELKKYYRYSFRKDVLVKQGFDKTKTENEVMIERGYLRIYDCGNMKFIY